jgi:FkbM family methyltransferase
MDSFQRDLIVDVGAHNGDDTAYYLARGFRVVAVEANPALAAAVTMRFQGQVATGTLTVLNVGIAPERGRLPFWVSERNSVLSSFDRDLVDKHGGGSHAVEVDAVPFAEILQQHGVPYYLKVDIEGHDRVCLDALAPQACPPYVSCELTHVGGIIEQLHGIGYRGFKLVNQSTYTEATPVFDSELALRPLRKLCRILPTLKRLLPQGVRSDFDTFPERHGYAFSQGSSGPFGEDTHGQWRRADDALRRFDTIRGRYVKAGVPVDQCWYDGHAKYPGA